MQSFNLKLDENNDIIIGRGAARTSGADYTLQLVKNRLWTRLGEVNLDRELGVPWTQLLDKGTNIGYFQAILYDTIQETPGVAQVTSIALIPNYSARTLTVTFTATTIYGNTITGDINGGR